MPHAQTLTHPLNLISQVGAVHRGLLRVQVAPAVLLPLPAPAQPGPALRRGAAAGHDPRGAGRAGEHCGGGTCGWPIDWLVSEADGLVNRPFLNVDPSPFLFAWTTGPHLLPSAAGAWRRSGDATSRSRRRRTPGSGEGGDSLGGGHRGGAYSDRHVGLHACTYAHYVVSG